MNNLKHTFCKIFVVIACVVALAASTSRNYAEGKENTPSYDKGNLAFGDDGILLYNKFFFESSGGGELFVVSDLTHKEIVPPGAVLVAIRKNYTLGYYEGKVELLEKGKVKKLDKVFFSLKSNGDIEYHRPSADRRFPGGKIVAKIKFI